APSGEARKAALNAAMAAFDTAQAARPKSARAGWLTRWRLGAGLGLPLGTAVAALVALPLGTQLYIATSNRVEAPPAAIEIADATTKPDVTVAAREAETAFAEPVPQVAQPTGTRDRSVS